ncbi:hypothetical protein D770_20480 [Flammeovirgaceae bacterium 311]|nr:hypothetical protein D770_20480 [Flammeovirgaceae bacterium 311]
MDNNETLLNIAEQLEIYERLLNENYFENNNKVIDIHEAVVTMIGYLRRYDGAAGNMEKVNADSSLENLLKYIRKVRESGNDEDFDYGWYQVHLAAPISDVKTFLSAVAGQ